MSERLKGFLQGLLVGVAIALVVVIGMQAVIGGPQPQSDSVGANVDRVVDNEAGVVCYYPPETESGVDCLPINQTDLSSVGDYND